MKKLLILSAILILAAPAFAQAPLPGNDAMFLSAATAAAGLEKCDTLHHEQTCDRYHVAGPAEPAPEEPVSTGTVLNLDGSHFQVDWAGEGFRLSDGTVVTKVATANGESWETVYPRDGGAVAVSGWSDTDDSSYLSIGDRLTVGGTAVEVTDHRFYLWVHPKR